jgi:DNA mismatch repair protein MutS2
LAISRRLGLNEEILEAALGNLSEDAQKFENIVRNAEESRIRADETLRECNVLKAEWQEKVALLNTEREKLQKEKEKLQTSAKAEARRIINSRAADAEELLQQIEEIFAQENLTEGDLIKARTLKNRLRDKAFDTENEDITQTQYQNVDGARLKIGTQVFVKTIGQIGSVQKIRLDKKEAEILCGSMRVRVSFSDLSLVNSNQKEQTKKKANVEVRKSISPKPAPTLELNVIGKTVYEALPDVEAFIDAAVISNLEEVRIVHGVGTGKLRAGIHEFLRTHKNVAEFRLGRYGEGETGVTIVKIK